jgi:membrane-associated HD superfamily phosphohydrolase
VSEVIDEESLQNTVTALQNYVASLSGDSASETAAAVTEFFKALSQRVKLSVEESDLTNRAVENQKFAAAISAASNPVPASEQAAPAGNDLDAAVARAIGPLVEAINALITQISSAADKPVEEQPSEDVVQQAASVQQDVPVQQESAILEKSGLSQRDVEHFMRHMGYIPSSSAAQRVVFGVERPVVQQSATSDDAYSAAKQLIQLSYKQINALRSIANAW